MYPEFANFAEEEGYPEIESVMRKIAVAEKGRENPYSLLMDNLNNGQVFKKDEIVIWKCGNCGYLHEGTEALEVCPACSIHRFTLNYGPRIIKLIWECNYGKEKSNRMGYNRLRRPYKGNIQYNG